MIVENQSKAARRGNERTVDGLRRIEFPVRGLSIEEEDNAIEVRARGGQAVNLTITVPPDTSLHLKSAHGDITAEGIQGEVEASSSNGEVRLLNISGTVVASSSNGDIKVTMDRVDPAKPLSFSSNNGDVDVTLPANVKANVKLRTLHGEVYSDFEFQLTSQPATATATGGGKDGKFRVVFDRTILGTINGGGTEASFNTLNGKILIRKK